MIQIQQWLSEVAQKQEYVSRYWLTRQEFAEIILDLVNHPESPLRGIQFSLEFESPYVPFQIGSPSDGEPESRRHNLNGSRTGICKINSWRIQQQEDADGLVYDAMKGLFNSWWKSDLRSDSAGLPDLKREAIGRTIAQETIQRLLNEKECPAVIFLDLDKFGEIDNTYGHPAGDSIIKQLVAIAEMAVAPYGILLHNGGDEFVIICPKNGSVAAVLSAFAAHLRVSENEFIIQSDTERHILRLRISSGMSSAASPKRRIGFTELSQEADSVLVNHVKKHFKGSARFFETDYYPTSFSLSEYVAFLKASVVSIPARELTFNNAWMDALVILVCDHINQGLQESDISSLVDSFLAWMIPGQGLLPILAGAPPDFDPHTVTTDAIFSPLSIAFVIVRGFLISRLHAEPSTITIRHSEDGASAIVMRGSLVVWKHGTETDCLRENAFTLHLCPNAEGRFIPTTPYAILIKIGHDPLPIPKHLFSEVIVVDDRPTRGGCLPDFWEATIARLINRLHIDPNVHNVFVMGNEANGAETVARLKSITDWRRNQQDIASRICVRLDMIGEAINRLEGHIHFPESYQHLILQLAHELDGAPTPEHVHQRIPAHKVFLERPLRIKRMALRKSDGCRVQTIAQAFPVVLEILRTADVPIIRDQAGQSLSELIDFKVHLSHPAQDMIPEYYHDQESSMNNYYHKAFKSNDHFFGKALNLGNQLNLVLDHIHGTISHSPAAFASRRGILIIPPDLERPGEWSPLGLVSIRVIPRFTGHRCELSYSFTWRTVEALVGFPYSLYGSVRYSQDLTQLIRERSHVDVRDGITTGFVSYIAHSLHLFKDDFAQTIVRRIVNDATI